MHPFVRFVLLLALLPGLARGQTVPSDCGGQVAAAAIISIIVCLVVSAGAYYFLVRKKENRKNTDPEAAGVGSGYDNPQFQDDTCITEVSEAGRSTGSSKVLEGEKSPVEKAITAMKTGAPSPKKHSDDSALSDPVRIIVPLQGKDFTGLGFNVKGNLRDGIYVKDVLSRGPAFESGKINTGDRVVALTVITEHISYEDALTLLSYASPYPLLLHLEKSRPATAGSIVPKGKTQPPGRRIKHPSFSQSVEDLPKIGSIDTWQLKIGCLQRTPITKDRKQGPLFHSTPADTPIKEEFQKSLNIEFPEAVITDVSIKKDGTKEATGSRPKFGIKVLPDLGMLKKELSRKSSTDVEKGETKIASDLPKGETDMPRVTVKSETESSSNERKSSHGFGIDFKFPKLRKSSETSKSEDSGPEGKDEVDAEVPLKGEYGKSEEDKHKSKHKFGFSLKSPEINKPTIFSGSKDNEKQSKETDGSKNRDEDKKINEKGEEGKKSKFSFKLRKPEIDFPDFDINFKSKKREEKQEDQKVTASVEAAEVKVESARGKGLAGLSDVIEVSLEPVHPRADEGEIDISLPEPSVSVAKNKMKISDINHDGLRETDVSTLDTNLILDLSKMKKESDEEKENIDNCDSDKNDTGKKKHKGYFGFGFKGPDFSFPGIHIKGGKNDKYENQKDLLENEKKVDSGNTEVPVISEISSKEEIINVMLKDNKTKKSSLDKQHAKGEESDDDSDETDDKKEKAKRMRKGFVFGFKSPDFSFSGGNHKVKTDEVKLKSEKEEKLDIPDDGKMQIIKSEEANFGIDINSSFITSQKDKDIGGDPSYHVPQATPLSSNILNTHIELDKGNVNDTDEMKAGVDLSVVKDTLLSVADKADNILSQKISTEEQFTISMPSVEANIDIDDFNKSVKIPENEIKHEIEVIGSTLKSHINGAEGLFSHGHTSVSLPQGNIDRSELSTHKLSMDSPEMPNLENNTTLAEALNLSVLTADDLSTKLILQSDNAKDEIQAKSTTTSSPEINLDVASSKTNNENKEQVVKAETDDEKLKTKSKFSIGFGLKGIGKLSDSEENDTDAKVSIDPEIDKTDENKKKKSRLGFGLKAFVKSSSESEDEHIEKVSEVPMENDKKVKSKGIGFGFMSRGNKSSDLEVSESDKVEIDPSTEHHTKGFHKLRPNLHFGFMGKHKSYDMEGTDISEHDIPNRETDPLDVDLKTKSKAILSFGKRGATKPDGKYDLRSDSDGAEADNEIKESNTPVEKTMTKQFEKPTFDLDADDVEVKEDIENKDGDLKSKEKGKGLKLGFKGFKNLKGKIQTEIHKIRHDSQSSDDEADEKQELKTQDVKEPNVNADEELASLSKTEESTLIKAASAARDNRKKKEHSTTSSSSDSSSDDEIKIKHEKKKKKRIKHGRPTAKSKTENVISHESTDIDKIEAVSPVKREVEIKLPDFPVQATEILCDQESNSKKFAETPIKRRAPLPPTVKEAERSPDILYFSLPENQTDRVEITEIVEKTVNERTIHLPDIMLETSNSFTLEKQPDWSSESDIDQKTEAKISVNFKANVHKQTLTDSEELKRKTASMGDLTKLQGDQEQLVLERAVSLDLKNVEEQNSKSTGLHSRRLQFPDSSAISIEEENIPYSFQKGIESCGLKKACEWGTLEDALLLTTKSNESLKEDKQQQTIVTSAAFLINEVPPAEGEPISHIEISGEKGSSFTELTNIGSQWKDNEESPPELPTTPMPSATTTIKLEDTANTPLKSNYISVLEKDPNVIVVSSNKVNQINNISIQLGEHKRYLERRDSSDSTSRSSLSSDNESPRADDEQEKTTNESAVTVMPVPTLRLLSAENSQASSSTPPPVPPKPRNKRPLSIPPELLPASEIDPSLVTVNWDMKTENGEFENSPSDITEVYGDASGYPQKSFTHITMEGDGYRGYTVTEGDLSRTVIVSTPTVNVVQAEFPLNFIKPE